VKTIGDVCEPRPIRIGFVTGTPQGSETTTAARSPDSIHQKIPTDGMCSGPDDLQSMAGVSPAS
jgi:hypothetical protein